MARPLRILHPGAWYHVTARGIERRALFRDDRDRTHFLGLLEELVARHDVALHAFVLMDNHYHLLLETLRPNLSRAVQWLNVSHSVWFNRRHRRSGYLFQGRFGSVVVDPAAWGLALSAYLHLNPVRVAALGLGKTDRSHARAGVKSPPAGGIIAERLRRLRGYRWSSYRAYIGLARRPDWLECARVLELGGGNVDRRSQQYRAYVENEVREGLTMAPWEELRDRVALGGARFWRRLQESAGGSPVPGAARARWRRGTVGWARVVEVVENCRGQRWADFHERHGDPGRDLSLYLARRATGLTVAQLAQAAGAGEPAAVSMALRRFRQRLERDPVLHAEAARAAEMLLVLGRENHWPPGPHALQPPRAAFGLLPDCARRLPSRVASDGLSGRSQQGH